MFLNVIKKFEKLNLDKFFLKCKIENTYIFSKQNQKHPANQRAFLLYRNSVFKQ